MKRPIKFRGKRVNNGEFVFGDLMHMTGNRIGIIFDKRVAAVEVDPDSVAQLVGYDHDGREVYEDDMLVDKLSNKFTARLVCRVLDDEGFLLDIPLEQLELTEA